jgi:tetratricopeptide (TPR) repeat protein
MFELVTMVLTMAKSDAYNSTADVADAELSSYAAKSWSDYLLRLNPCVPHKTKYEYPGAESVIMMISNVLDVDEIRNDALAKIENQTKINRTNADKIAKSIWDWSNMYLEEDGYGPKRAKLKSFCRRMSKGCRNLSEGCQNRSKCYRNVCKEIARAHAQNWRFSKFPVEAYTCFQLANQMLRYSGRKEFKAEITADSIIEVSEKLWGKSYSAQDYKCLAMALRYNGHYDEALSKANLGLELDPNNPPNDPWTKFELYDRIGRINFGDVEDSYPRKDDKGKLREALRNLDEAVKYGEKCSKDKEKGKEKVERTKQLKLKIEIKLNSCLEEEKKIIGGNFRVPGNNLLR